MNYVFRFLFWGACAALIVLALIPGAYLPPDVFNWWDKAQHALAFLALGGLGLLAYPKTARLVLMGLLVYGAAIELAQAATGWRYGDVQDWFADAVGVAAAYLIGWGYGVASS
jgi:VanZ family protein